MQAKESERIHGGTSRSMLKERSSFFAAIGRSSSMQSYEVLVCLSQDVEGDRNSQL